jgi:SAM-dependent methyltransferase
MTTPRWFLDELAHAGSEHLDAGSIAGYDRKAGTDPLADVALLRARGLNETHTLVDFGAGTGTFALAVAPFCRRVVAVDVSPPMLRALREKAARHGILNIECVTGGFLTYTHQGAAADFVYSRHALHHLPDFWKAIALQRIAALMRLDGVLHLRDLIFSCEPAEIPSLVEGWLANATTHPASGWTRAELETHLREEYSTFSWLLEPLIVRAGFAIQQVEHSDSQIYSAYTCVKRR